jgi:hypothetical protein
VKNTTISTTPVPEGNRDEILHFPKTYPHENKLRNQHLSAAEASQKTNRRKQREVKTRRDQPLIVADKKKIKREKKPARRTAMTPS